MPEGYILHDTAGDCSDKELLTARLPALEWVHTYVIFYEIVDECSKTRLGHVVTQCINIPRVFCSSCIKTCHQVCHQKKLGCHQVSWHARVMVHPLKSVQKLKKTPSSWRRHSVILTFSVEMLKNQRVAVVCSNLEDQVCQAEKIDMSDVHVLVCSDFYSKSSLGEMWVKCIKRTGCSHSACSDGSDLYVCDIC